MSFAIQLLYPDILLKAPTCPVPSLNRAIIRAAQRLCNESHWVARVTSGLVCTPSNPTVTLVDASAEEIIAVQDVEYQGLNGKWQPLDIGLPGTMNENLLPDAPRRYSFVPYSSIFLSPPPVDAYPIQARVIVQPTDDATVLPDELKRKYRNAVIDGAISFILETKGEEYTDLNLAEMYETRFKAGIANAKTDAVRGGQTGTMRPRPRRFIVGGLA